MSLPSLSYSSSHIEDWLDNHPDFVENYFLRKANRRLVDKWIQKHATTTHISPSDSLDKQDIALPIRKISSQQFETISGDLQPMVSSIIICLSFIVESIHCLHIIQACVSK